MSTRCTINFCQSRKTIAKIYRHSDGYPDGPCGVLADLDTFFAAVEAQTTDTRFGDPSYLAAKFVVWQAEQNTKYTPIFAKTDPAPLNFLSLGIITRDPGDIEHTYFVDCDTNGRPTVRHKAIY